MKVNWYLLAFFAAIFIPSLATLLLEYSGQDLTWMRADRSTLSLGLVTANFVNEGLERFAVNMGLFALFLAGFAVVDGFCDESGRRRRALFLVGAVMICAVVAILFLVYLGGGGTGSSGIVYATAGVMLGFTTVQRGWTSGLREKGLPRSLVKSYVLLFGILVGPLAALLGSGNAIVHLMALLLGFPTGRLQLVGGGGEEP